MGTDAGAQAVMHYSGIVVVADGELDRCARDLEALAGVEVHFCYPDSHRIIAVQETETATEQEEGLRRIQALSSVRLAALLEHRIDRQDEPGGTE